MAGDLATMKSRVADELARADLTSQIASAINDAIGFYQNDRFAFNESRDVTFATVAGQDIYTTSSIPTIASVFYFDYIILYLGSIPWPLPRDTPEGIEIFNQNGLVRGQPTRWSYYNKALRLGPVPDAVYTVRIAAQGTIAAPATDNEASNPWMIDAELLIRKRAKYELALNVLRDTELAGTLAPQVMEAYDNMKGLTNRLTATGRISPMAF